MENGKHSENKDLTKENTGFQSGILTYKNIIFAIMLVLVLIFISNIADIAIMLFVAFIITCAIDPSVNFLQKYMPRVLAVSLVLLAILICILLVFIPLLTVTIEQTTIFIQSIPTYIKNFQDFLHTNHFGILLSKYINPDAINSANADITNITGEILSKGADISKLIVNSITSSIAVAIMVFYFSYDEKHMRKRFLEFFPPKFKQKAENILNSIKTKVGGYVFAQALSMIIVGLLSFIGLLIIGNSHALLIGFLACILDIIPVIGATVAVAVALYTAISGGLFYVILTFIIMMLAQWLQNQIFRPILFGKFMDTHPLLIIVSLLIGAKFMGFWGVVLAPAMASIVCVLIDELYIKPINKNESLKEAA